MTTDLAEACHHVMLKCRDWPQYRFGMTPKEIIGELYAEYGVDAFSYVSIFDVVDALNELGYRSQ